jgi:transcription-repair coupling factor (superfamily II helicase)
MKENDLTGHYKAHPTLPSLIETIHAGNIGQIRVGGLSGSSRSMVLSLAFKSTHTTHLVILPEKEDAAYLYNDLISLTGEESVFFFPSTYKRSVQYEQTEPANIVLRTEVLNHLASVMEKVVSMNNLKKNTFNITRGDRISLEFMEELLHEYNFVRTDFVYEPGQYSIRGSIADIFSYSADLPIRIDFFGEEVESIRSFNADDQLSVSSHKQVSVIPNIQDISIEEVSDSLTDYLPPSSLIWMDDAELIREKANNIYLQTVQRQDTGQITMKIETIMTGDFFIDQSSAFRIIEFGRTGIFEPGAGFEFHTEPQPVFNKNFEILTGKLLSNKEEGYITYIVSESESQIERLRDIFEEINPEVAFVPLLINIHKGFTDHDLKISV